MFTAALLTIAKIWKQQQCLSMDEWRKKTQRIYTMEYYSTTRKKEILLFATTWMDPEGYAKWDKLHRERQILYDITYMWNLKKAKLIETE